MSDDEQTALVVQAPPALERTAVVLWGTDNPRDMTARMGEIADAMSAVVESRKLYSVIQGNKYVKVEGWSMVGAMLGVFPRTEATDVVESGFLPETRNAKGKVFPAHDGAITFRARVVLATRDGGTVGGAEAMCSRREEQWRDRDDNQIASMAQTRATAKAFRMSLGFIMPMSGYAPTPAEEMDGIVDTQHEAERAASATPASARQAPAAPPARQERPARQAPATLAVSDIKDVQSLMTFAAQQRAGAGLPVDGRAVLRVLGVEVMQEIVAKYGPMEGGWQEAGRAILADIELATGKPADQPLQAQIDALSEGDQQLYEQMVANGETPEDALNIIEVDDVGESANAADDEAAESEAPPA